MPEHDKSLVKSSTALARFDPKARKELVVRGLNALTEVRDADFYFFKGEEHRMGGELNQAIAYYEKALQIDPEHEDSLFWMGYSYSPDVEECVGDDIEIDNTIRNERAALAFQKLVDVRKKKDSIGWSSYVAYYNLGLAQCHLALYKKAMESFEQATELNSDHANSYYMLGLSQEEIGIYHLALENFEIYLLLVDRELAEKQRYITSAQEYAEWLRGQLTDDYFFSVGFDFWNNSQYQEAVECYEKVIELNPDYTNAYYNLALAQDEVGIYHLALKNFETYLSLDNYKTPKTPKCVEYAKRRIKELKGLLTYTYFSNLGIKFWKKGQYEEAIECYEQAIELNPSFADAYYNLAITQDALNLHNSALDNFEIYLRLEDYELSENQQFITYANNRMKELREILRKSKKKRKLFEE